MNVIACISHVLDSSITKATRYNLGAVYVMDHEVVSCSYEVCDWPLNSYEDHYGLHQDYKVKSDHGTRGPPNAYF